jgi:hypothetical protein
MANNNDWLDAMIRDYARGYLFTQMAIGCLFLVFILALAGSVLVLVITSYLQRGH